MDSASTAWSVLLTASSSPEMVPNCLTGTFYFRYRAKISAGDALASIWVGIVQAGGNLHPFKLGLIGSVSTTHFSYAIRDTGGAIQHSAAMSTALDTNWHTFELWQTGGTASFAIDEGAPATVANTLSTTFGGTCGWRADNGGTGTNRTVLVSSAQFCGVRA